MNRYKIYTLALMVFMGLSLACEGPEGPIGAIGPAGPQGAAGNQGPAGTQGPTGTQGQMGADNVFFSSWITNTWTRMPDNFVGDTIPAPQITEEILNKGVVVAYYRDNSNSTFAKIYPVQIYQAGTQAWMFTLEMKSIKEKLIMFHGPTRVPGFDAANVIPFSQVRYMVIPGVTPTGRLNYPDFDDYEAVCAYFGVNL
jgi:hypothetical protein